ncbi:MAG TPA: hypothetical protein VMF67_01685 [Rhizomicrobium sp.]|nr:hypothetical protein [Rhizomicrobium sp.]
MAFYVACGPHSNIIGAYPLLDGYVAADLNWSMEETQAVMSELVQSGFVKRFGRGEYLLLCRHRDWNTVANHNVMKAAFKELRTLPPDPVLHVIIEWLRPLCIRFGKGLPEQLETVRVRLLEPFRNTEAQPPPAPPT